jgi:hypothetical protein
MPSKKGQILKRKFEGFRLKPAQKEMVFSFRDFDQTQGQTFAEWQDIRLLDRMLDKLKEYSKKTVSEAQKASFTVYDRFPPKSEFKPPQFIPENVKWASLHIQGKECIAGHLMDNTFYVVFLDKNHRFWPSILKHT